MAGSGAVTVDGVGIAMPPEWGPTQLKKAFESSVIGQLSQSTPLPLGDYNVAVYEGGFEMGYTPEMGRKPVSGVSFSFKNMKPVKLAGILVVSEEAARRNPAQMLSFVEADMRNSVARAIDYAVFYGKSAFDGTAIPGATSINATTKRGELDFTKDLVPQLLTGYNALMGVPNTTADPNGWAFDTTMRGRLALAAQQQVTLPGAVMPTPDLRRGVDTLMGLPTAFGRTVSGRVGTQADTQTRGFLGDYNKLRWGYASSIDIKRSTETVVLGADGQPIYLWQQNAMALLIEVMVGWTILDPNAFYAFDDKVNG